MGSWQTIWQTSKVETHIKSMNRYILKFATVAVAVSAQKREFLKCAQIKKQMVTGEVAQEDREWAKENCLKLLGKGKGGKFRGALREAAMQASGDRLFSRFTSKFPGRKKSRIFLG